MKMFSRAKALLAIMAIAGAVLLGLPGSGDEAVASNMGFKENKQIFAKDGAPRNGENLVALPFNNPYATSQDICDAIAGAAPACRIVQINALAGITSTDSCSAAGGAFPLLQRVGILVDSCTAPTAGILVGSHAPGVAINLYPQVSPVPKGFNHYPIPFHTTNANMQNVCTDLGLAAPNRILRYNADNGVTSSWTCGGGGASPVLVLGESLIIDSLSVASAPVPSHF